MAPEVRMGAGVCLLYVVSWMGALAISGWSGVTVFLFVLGLALIVCTVRRNREIEAEDVLPEARTVRR